MGGAPDAVANVDMFCNDLQRQIAASTRTLNASYVQAERALSSRHQHMDAENVATAAKHRRLVNQSLGAQLQLQQHIMSSWLAQEGQADEHSNR
jgi:hypothetical protein